MRFLTTLPAVKTGRMSLRSPLRFLPGPHSHPFLFASHGKAMSFPHGDSIDQFTTYLIGDRRILASDPHLSQILASAYEAGTRPRCLCREGGVDMCIVKDGILYLRRMPHSGPSHHPMCEWFEPEPFDSGYGYALREALTETRSGIIEVRADFPLQRMNGHAIARGAATEQHVVRSKQRPLTLRGLLHLIWDRAQFNRWSPKMQGKRHWGVIRHYCLQAAAGIELKGLLLTQRLFMPETFRSDLAAELTARRVAAFTPLLPASDAAQCPLMLLIGEVKELSEIPAGYKLLVKHLPDCPFFLDARTGARCMLRFADTLQAQALFPGTRLIAAFTFALKAVDQYQVDTLTLMTTTATWIPFRNTPEKRLTEALIEQGRRFIKPLDYDMPDSVAIPEFLLLDADQSPVRLHILASTTSKTQRRAKEALIAKEGEGAWVWNTESSLTFPPLPPARVAFN